MGKNFDLELLILGDAIVGEEISRQLTSFGLKTTVRTLGKELFFETIKDGKFEMTITYSFKMTRHPF